MGATVWKAVAAPRGARGGGGERSEPDPTETPREGDGSAVAVWAAVWARRAASRLGQARRAASWPGRPVWGARDVARAAAGALSEHHD